MNDATKMKIKDAALTLVYRLRFEVMPRLEWVEVSPRRNIRLIDLVWRAGGLGPGLARRPRPSPRSSRLLTRGSPDGNTLG